MHTYIEGLYGGHCCTRLPSTTIAITITITIAIRNGHAGLGAVTMSGCNNHKTATGSPFYRLLLSLLYWPMQRFTRISENKERCCSLCHRLIEDDLSHQRRGMSLQNRSQLDFIMYQQNHLNLNTTPHQSSPNKDIQRFSCSSTLFLCNCCCCCS